jgi:hypothetical protein
MASDKQTKPFEVSLEYFAELKKAHRRELLALPPDQAQADVETILHPRLWRIEYPQQLSWPGDWADDEKGD